jgi:hypothetical protein
MEGLKIKKKFQNKKHKFGAGGVMLIGNLNPVLYSHYNKTNPEWFETTKQKNDKVKEGDNK